MASATFAVSCAANRRTSFRSGRAKSELMVPWSWCRSTPAPHWSVDDHSTAAARGRPRCYQRLPTRGKGRRQSDRGSAVNYLNSGGLALAQQQGQHALLQEGPDCFSLLLQAQLLPHLAEFSRQLVQRPDLFGRHERILHVVLFVCR